MVRPVKEYDTGIVILREPKPQEGPADVDIVAIHGIGAHPDDSWTTQSKEDGAGHSRWVNWLSDETMLPVFASNARIMRYGYQSSWFGDGALAQNVTRLAQLFILALDRAREHCPYRPIIFIAHCFGGLVVLKTLLKAREYPNECLGLFKSTSGLVFLGTPFRGSGELNQAKLLATARSQYGDNVQPEILEILEPGKEILQDLVDGFCKARGEMSNCQVACFYELKPSDVEAIIGNETIMRFVVNESSGCLDPFDNTSKFPLSRTHFDMNKFSSPIQEDFLNVKGVLKRIIEKAIGVAQNPRSDDTKLIESGEGLGDPGFAARHSVFNNSGPKNNWNGTINGGKVYAGGTFNSHGENFKF